MKNLLNGFATAFSMYSIIPMPQTKWDKNSMKYAMCFFPIVGGFIGGVVYIWNRICMQFGINGFLFSAVMVLLPFIISGGIHLDGLIDTADALYSRRETEKKLEILKDPHVGAFGVIICVSYYILQFGLWGQFYENPQFIGLIAVFFIFSRALSGFSIVTFKMARNTGLAHIFNNNADKKTVQIVLGVYIVAIAGLAFFMNWLVGSVMIIVALSWFFMYKRMCYKQFGGLTGDLAGYFLQIMELLILIIATIGGLVCKL